MKLALGFLALITAIPVGCFDSDEVLRARVENELRANLAVGDSAEKVERVLKEEGLPFDFDRFNHRYQAGFVPKEKRMIERFVGIYVYVDQSKRITRIEVTNSYTFL
jgi:hypothetical protein